MVRSLADAGARLAGLVGREVEAPEFSREVSVALAAALPFDGWCLFGMDPETGLRTFQFGGRGTEHTSEMARNEASMPDLNKYSVLAAAPVPVGWLSPEHPQARRSFRLHEILLPQGFYSELRVVLRDQRRLWGALVLFREDPRRPFDDHDTRAVNAIIGPLTSAVRAYPVRPLSRRGRQPGAGVIALDAGNKFVAVSADAQSWLDDLVPGGDDQTYASDVTRVVLDSALAVRRGDLERASTSIRTVSGHWLRVQAMALDLGETDVTVVLQPATPHQLLGILSAYYLLTPRECEILDLLAYGLAGKHIAHELGISLQTVNKHLQSLYRKCGVTGREELIGRLV
jgi:DNA-binding CsgD family transcriptional regulator